MRKDTSNYDLQVDAVRELFLSFDHPYFAASLHTCFYVIFSNKPYWDNYVVPLDWVSFFPDCVKALKPYSRAKPAVKSSRSVTWVMPGKMPTAEASKKPNAAKWA